MNRRQVTAGAIIFFLVGAVAGNYIVKLWRQSQVPEPSAQTETLLVGSPLPKFSLLALDGVRENSEQWLGKVQVINIWSTTCPPCKREIPTLIQLQNEYQNQGLQVIGVAMDKKEAVQDYVREMGINYPILVGQDDVIDLAEKLGNDFGLIPYTVIADSSGNIAFIKYGEIDRETAEREIKALF